MNNEKITMHPAGPAFEELTLEEMVASQGSGDVKPETSAVCISIAASESSEACLALSVDVTIATISFASSKC